MHTETLRLSVREAHSKLRQRIHHLNRHGREVPGEVERHRRVCAYLMKRYDLDREYEMESDDRLHEQAEEAIAIARAILQ